MRIFNGNFIVKHSQALYARDMPYHFSDSLTVQFTPEFLHSIFVIAFLPELMAEKSLDTLISRAKLFAVIAVSREKERRARLYVLPPFLLFPVGSSECSDGNETFLLALYRARGTQSAG